MDTITFFVLLVLLGWALISLYKSIAYKIETDEDDDEEDLLL